MRRPTPSRLAFVAVAMATLVVAGCSGGRAFCSKEAQCLAEEEDVEGRSLVLLVKCRGRFSNEGARHDGREARAPREPAAKANHWLGRAAAPQHDDAPLGFGLAGSAARSCSAASSMGRDAASNF